MYFYAENGVEVMLYVVQDLPGARHIVDVDRYAFTVCRRRAIGMKQITELVPGSQGASNLATCPRCKASLATDSVSG